METTLIGSLPYKEPEVAVEKSFSCVTIPCWPQLPKRSFKEQMCPQYSEKFPGIIVDENKQKVYLDENRLWQEIEKFYQNYLDKNIDYFQISEEYAAGLYKFLEYVKNVNTVKLQTTGPLTFAFTVKTLADKAIFYNDQYRDLVIKHLVMKTMFQIKMLIQTKNMFDKIIVFYDEPYLAAYGSAFTSVTKEDIVKTLAETVNETKKLTEQLYENIKLKIGIHCCANTDWSILTSVDKLDIISFDTYEFFDNFVLYHNEINNFLSTGGEIAWGIIPNNEKVFNETISSLFDKLKYDVQLLKNKNVKISDDSHNFLITPQCGLGNANKEVVEKVLEICQEMSNL